MKYILIFILPLLPNGYSYINNRSIDTNHHNNCEEYYNSMGDYCKIHDENLIEYQDVKDGVKKIYDELR